VLVFEAEVLHEFPGYEIEITCDTQFSIAHAAPSDVSLPAVSSFEGLRTPAPVCAAPPSWGRHPKTFTKGDLIHTTASEAKPDASGPRQSLLRRHGHFDDPAVADEAILPAFSTLQCHLTSAGHGAPRRRQ
jgi:hypothetical protein